MLFSGVGGNPRGIFDSSWGNFGPRFGAAYQLDQHTVLRGGYALDLRPDLVRSRQCAGFHPDHQHGDLDSKRECPPTLWIIRSPPEFCRPAGASWACSRRSARTTPLPIRPAARRLMCTSFPSKSSASWRSDFLITAGLRGQPVAPHRGHTAAQCAAACNAWLWALGRALAQTSRIHSRAACRELHSTARPSSSSSCSRHIRSSCCNGGYRELPADRKVKLQLSAVRGHEAAVLRA